MNKNIVITLIILGWIATAVTGLWYFRKEKARLQTESTKKYAELEKKFQAMREQPASLGQLLYPDQKRRSYDMCGYSKENPLKPRLVLEGDITGVGGIFQGQGPGPELEFRFGVWSPDCTKYVYDVEQFTTGGSNTIYGVWLFNNKTKQNTRLTNTSRRLLNWLSNNVVVVSGGFLNIKTKELFLFPEEDKLGDTWTTYYKSVYGSY